MFYILINISILYSNLL